jgi:hypothetical protein
MRAALKYLQSPDIDDLATFCPKEPSKFCFLLQMMVGPAAEEGAESFDVTVCTPQWLIEHCPTDVILEGRHYLFVMEYDFAQIQNYLQQRIEACVGGKLGSGGVAGRASGEMGIRRLYSKFYLIGCEMLTDDTHG